MAFVNKQDIISSNRMCEDELNEMVRQDDTVIEYCCNEAESTIKAMLNDYYDTDVLLNATGSDRDTLLVGIALDFAVYNLCAGSQAGVDITDRRMRYNNAMAMIERATQPQSDKTSIFPTWTRKDNTAEDKILFVNNRHKRNNYPYHGRPEQE